MRDDEFYAAAAQKRLQQLAVDRMKAQHDLAISLSMGDEEAAAGEIDSIAEIDAKTANLRALAQREMARNQAQTPPPQTAEQLRAKPPEQMTWEDGLEIARNSKYGKDLDFNNPHVVAGYHEATRRRQRGE